MVVMHDINETLEVTGDLSVDMVHLKTGTITEIDQYFSSAAVQMESTMTIHFHSIRSASVTLHHKHAVAPRSPVPLRT